jgi:hypothetical protein
MMSNSQIFQKKRLGGTGMWSKLTTIGSNMQSLTIKKSQCWGGFAPAIASQKVTLPYDSAQGGYHFINGGPYHPTDVIRGRFEGKASEDAIAMVIDELLVTGDEWAPVIEQNDEDPYDEDFGITVHNPKDPNNVLERRLSEIEEILTLTGSEGATALAQRLAYSNVITALESYLWETLTYAVDNDEKVLRNIVTKIGALKEQKMQLGEIFDKFAGLKAIVKGYLQNLVWHRWDDVAQLLKYGLEIEPPSFKPFIKATVKRHDIVHRSGHDKDGNAIILDRAEIANLMWDVRRFAMSLESELLERYAAQINEAMDAGFAQLEADLDRL